MLSDAQRANIARSTATLQIIVGAMAAGVLALIAIVLVVGPAQPAGKSVLTFLGVGAAIVLVVLPAFVMSSARHGALSGGQLGRSADRAGDRETAETAMLVKAHFTRTVVTAALLEAGALVNVAAYLVDGEMLNLNIAVIVLVLLLIKFPRKSKSENSLERALNDLEQWRQMGPGNV